MVVMTTATITSLMPVHPRRLFGIGAMPIRVTTLRYPNARFRGDKLFNNQVGKPRPASRRREAVIQPSEWLGLEVDPVGSSYRECLSQQNAPSGSVHARVRRL